MDDDPDIQAVLADRLAALGYRVCIAATGRNGLALLEAEGPQLVLLDLGLPDMNGLDVLTAMRTRVPDVMVVMITAYGTVAEAVTRVAAVDVDFLLEQMAEAKNRVNVVILDACRNNPFERRLRGASRGLAAVDAAQGTLIAYATAPGSVAADGEGTNGLYTEELLRALRVPGLKIEEVFKQVRVAVVERSKGTQKLVGILVAHWRSHRERDRQCHSSHCCSPLDRRSGSAVLDVYQGRKRSRVVRSLSAARRHLPCERPSVVIVQQKLLTWSIRKRMPGSMCALSSGEALNFQPPSSR